jgi:hypothetical protein
MNYISVNTRITTESTDLAFVGVFSNNEELRALRVSVVAFDWEYGP